LFAYAETLTTGTDDTLLGTIGDDVVTGTTLEVNDLVIDETSTDNDTMNLTLSAANGAARVEGIENINVDLNVFSGGEFVATNVTDATITGSSSKLGFDGELTVTNAVDNDVVAGSGVTDLIVTALEAGTIDAGTADTVVVDHGGVVAAEVIAVTVNGDVDVDADFSGAGTSEALNLTATAASVVTLNAGSTVAVATLTVTGAGDVSIDTEAANVTGATVTGVDVLKIVDGAGGLDAENLTVGSIDASVAVAITNADGQTIDITKANVTTSVAGAGTADEAVTVNISEEQATGAISVTGVDTSAINFTADVTDLAALVIEGEATVTVAGDFEFSTGISQTAATDELVIAGTGDVTIADTDVDDVDSSALTGDLDFTTTTDADFEIVAGSGDDTIVLAQTVNVAAITTGNGANSIDASTVTAGTLALTGGTGVDTVTFLDLTGATVAMAGGAGADVINIGDGTAVTTDLSAAATWAVTGFTDLTTTDVAGSSVIAQVVTVLGSQMTGLTAASITGPTTGTSDDTFAIEVAADAATTDLSGLVLADIAAISVEVTGQATADAITGTNGNDSIISAGGADVLAGGAGADSFVFAASDSTEAAMASISDFSLTEFDVLTNTSTMVVNVAAQDVSGVTSEVGDTVTASTTSGIMTLAGDDAANIDTLAEWIDAAEVLLAVADVKIDSLAFEFDGNTYVVDDAAAGGTQNVIELTDLTDIVALGTAAAINTLVIA